MRKISRRAALAAFPIAAVAVAAPALAIPLSHSDAALEAAWQRILIARDTLDMIGKDWDTKAEREQWAIVDEAEAVIQSTPAKTPQGVAVQLWLSLLHTLDTRDHDELVRARNLDALDSTEVDWNARCILAALRSLEAMAAQSLT